MSPKLGILMVQSISRFAMVRSRGGEAPPGAIRGDLPIRIDRDALAAFCRARGIRKLSLFGSVIRDDFDPRRSDVDVLAEFAPGVCTIPDQCFWLDM